MSAICGIYEFSSFQINTSELTTLNLALKDSGQDGSYLWQQANIGFGQQITAITSEDYREILPYHHSNGDVTICGNIRLFNRNELCQQLSLREDIVDSQIVLAAYFKYGKNFPGQLLGEFSIALYDNKSRELILVSDHFCQHSIYYYHDNKKLVFASQQSALRQLTSINAPLNFKKIATAHLFSYSEKSGETFFENISFLPAASMLVINGNGKSELTRYWHPTLGAIKQFKSEHDFTDEFQSLFGRIISDHCRNSHPICSLLSGGMDSSAITAMTSRVLGQQRSLNSLSAVLPLTNNSQDQDESYYINLFTADNLSKHFITDVERGPFDNLTDIIDSPQLTSRHYLYRAFNNAARKQGSRIILDGCFGELGPTYWGDEYLGELLRQLKFVQLFHNIQEHRKLFGRSWRSILFHNLLKPNLPAHWQLRLQTRRDLDLSNTLNLVRPEFIAKSVSPEYLVKGIQEFKQIGVISSISCRENNLENINLVLKRRNGSGIIRETKQLPINYSFPFLDPRMIEFCLSLPNDLRFKDGYRRYAIRKGMEGVLPNEIRWRTSKEPFSPDYHHRYNRQLTIARDAVATLKHNPLVCEVIDIPLLEKYLQIEMSSNRCYAKTDFIGMHIVPQAIYLASFLNNNS